MNIEKVLLEKWKALWTPGDAQKLAEKLKDGYPQAFTRAMREGKCNETVFKLMADFFERKADMIREYL